MQINNAFHNNPFIGQLMVAMTEFGREAFWTIATLLIFIFGGKTGKKNCHRNCIDDAFPNSYRNCSKRTWWETKTVGNNS